MLKAQRAAVEGSDKERLSETAEPFRLNSGAASAPFQAFDWPNNVIYYWPEGLRTMFDIWRAKSAPFEYRYCYYGPYDNNLLNYCFHNCFKYVVALQNAPQEGSRDGVEFPVSFVVFYPGP
ncbi:hypothetical protein F5I97DRAFT_1828453 [Phlebopus sp. FC_14]|nr:hypothetical protein F5I97DRAFT_1828453 [Phlebopus sp. FC_14]